MFKTPIIPTHCGLINSKFGNKVLPVVPRTGLLIIDDRRRQCVAQDHRKDAPDVDEAAQEEQQRVDLGLGGREHGVAAAFRERANACSAKRNGA